MRILSFFVVHPRLQKSSHIPNWFLFKFPLQLHNRFSISVLVWWKFVWTLAERFLNHCWNVVLSYQMRRLSVDCGKYHSCLCWFCFLRSAIDWISSKRVFPRFASSSDWFVSLFASVSLADWLEQPLLFYDCQPIENRSDNRIISFTPSSSSSHVPFKHWSDQVWQTSYAPLQVVTRSLRGYLSQNQCLFLENFSFGRC